MHAPNACVSNPTPIKPFSITAAYHGATTPSSQDAIAQFKITSVPDAVNKNATVAPWITLSVQQDGDGLLSLKNASAVETYVKETTTYPAPAAKPAAVKPRTPVKR